MPALNRAAIVPRAINSLLAQDCSDWELVVVDSASSDGTRDVVRRFAADDSRIRLVCEEQRRGVCPARNLGIDHSRGDWMVPLDTDDELPPGTLTLFRQRIAARPYIDHHRFMCRWDDGTLSPRPPLVEEEWDYDGYLRFLEATVDGNGETQSCIRMATFREVRYPEDRSYEMLYHLDFVRRFRTRAHPEVARLYHTDAEDQNSFAPNPRHWLRVAPDVAKSYETILARHGEAMRRVAPRAYDETLRAAAKFHFMAGQRRAALRTLRTLWRRKPFSPLSVAMLGIGVLGKHATAYADASSKYFRR